MRGPELLQQHADCLKSRMGKFFPGERVVFRGHDLHSELNDMDWVELFVFGITGRRFTREQLRLMHAIWVYTSFPDARIWNNRVAALAGSARSNATLGLSAALAVSEASIYGGGIYIPSITFLKNTLVALEKGAELTDCIGQELAARRGIAGYGRPLISRDERIAPIMALAKTLGLGDGPHVRLAFAVDEALLAGRWRLRMNYAGLASALCADLGLSAREYHLYMIPAFMAGMLPCTIESSDNMEGTLFPLSTAHIKYEGAQKRPWLGSR